MYKGYQTNNIYPDFPPLMNDGRSVTAAYNPNAVQTEQIVIENNLKTSWEYRNFLTRNATKVRDHNYLDALNEFGYTATPADIVVYGKPVSEGARGAAALRTGGVDTPYIFTSVMDNNRRARDVFSSDSDLKTTYLTREQLNARRVAPVWTGVTAEGRA